MPAPGAIDGNAVGCAVRGIQVFPCHVDLRRIFIDAQCSASTCNESELAARRGMPPAVPQLFYRLAKGIVLRLWQPLRAQAMRNTGHTIHVFVGKSFQPARDCTWRHANS